MIHQEINKKNPLVSIIVPFFNQEKFLGEAIESVLTQTYKNWELILVNDGSIDKSPTIARKFAQKFPEQIHFLTHNQNKGASAARNSGIGKAKGAYLAFLDSDDVFFPHTIERELNAFYENPAADVVCGTLECWYSWSKHSSARERDFIINLVLETEKLYQPPALLLHNLQAGGRKPGIDCLLLKRDFVNRIGIFEDNYKYVGEDQVFWAKVSLHGKIFVLSDCLARYRQHPASTCAVTIKTGQDASSMNIFLDWLEKYLREQKIEDDEVWRSVRQFQKSARFQARIKIVKQIYRRILPLSARYRLRDEWTTLKKKLLRSAHREKK